MSEHVVVNINSKGSHMGSAQYILGPFLLPILNLITLADGSLEAVTGSLVGTD